MIAPAVDELVGSLRAIVAGAIVDGRPIPGENEIRAAVQDAIVARSVALGATPDPLAELLPQVIAALDSHARARWLLGDKVYAETLAALRQLSGSIRPSVKRRVGRPPNNVAPFVRMLLQSWYEMTGQEARASWGKTGEPRNDACRFLVAAIEGSGIRPRTDGALQKTIEREITERRNARAKSPP